MYNKNAASDESAMASKYDWNARRVSVLGFEDITTVNKPVNRINARTEITVTRIRTILPFYFFISQ